MCVCGCVRACVCVYMCMCVIAERIEAGECKENKKVRESACCMCIYVCVS